MHLARFAKYRAEDPRCAGDTCCLLLSLLSLLPIASCPAGLPAAGVRHHPHVPCKGARPIAGRSPAPCLTCLRRDALTSGPNQRWGAQQSPLPVPPFHRSIRILPLPFSCASRSTLVCFELGLLTVRHGAVTGVSQSVPSRQTNKYYSSTKHNVRDLVCPDKPGKPGTLLVRPSSTCLWPDSESTIGPIQTVANLEFRPMPHLRTPPPGPDLPSD